MTSCPICKESWPSAKLALRCWYKHPASEGGRETLARLSLPSIAGTLGITPQYTYHLWRFLQKYEKAPKRAIKHETGEAYQGVVHYFRQRKKRKLGPEHGWTVKLAKQLGISPIRVASLRKAAIKRGDLPLSR